MPVARFWQGWVHALYTFTRSLCAVCAALSAAWIVPASEHEAGKPVIAARGHDPTSPTTVEAVHVTPEDPRSAKAVTVDGMFSDDPPPPPPPPPGNAPFANRRIWTGLLSPRYVAVMTTSVARETLAVGMVTVAVLFPDPTLTLEGGRASCPLLVNATTAPPSGAGPSSVTVPVTGSPPVCSNGVMVKVSNLLGADVGGGAGAGVGAGAGPGEGAGTGSGGVSTGVTTGAGAEGAAIALGAVVDASLESLSHAAAVPTARTRTLIRRTCVLLSNIDLHPSSSVNRDVQELTNSGLASRCSRASARS